MAESGQKMGDYIPLESNKKEYFLGDGEGSVVAVGKTEVGGEKTNRLVKLKDVVGNTKWSTERNTTSTEYDEQINIGMAYDVEIGGTKKLVKINDSNVKAGYDPSVGGTSIEPPLHLGQLWFNDHSGQQENPDVYVATGNTKNSQWKLLHKGGGTTGQVLTMTANGEAWADPETELPSGGSIGDVLTKTANGVAWSAPSGGGGGAAYAKNTVALSDMDEEDYFQTISVNNNAYNICTGRVNRYTELVKINLAATELPDTYVELNTASGNNYGSSALAAIEVYNGSTKLTRLKPSGVLDDIKHITGGGVYDWGGVSEELFDVDTVVVIRIQGSTYTIDTSTATITYNAELEVS